MMAETPTREQNTSSGPQRARWRSFFARDSVQDAPPSPDDSPTVEKERRPTKWAMGVLNDKYTHEVPGSVLLLTGARNEPLGLRNAPARVSSSSLPSPYPTPQKRSQSVENKKTTKDGAIVLDPQPDDSSNDPLNWPTWRRDSALLSLGFYCMLGGGMTPILAAGFTNVASDYDVTVPQVALTTGLYMMGLGVGSVIASPTAILFGKRPVYLFSCILFVATSIWCAASPSYASLVVARVFQGMSVSPVECLPSATIAEIFFLHERAYRIGIYTLLLLGGKNLVPLVSAAVIQAKGWRWVFWVVAIIVGFCWFILFLFVPETFWDRTPRPKSRAPSRKPSDGGGLSALFHSRRTSLASPRGPAHTGDAAGDEKDLRRLAASNSAQASVMAVRPSVIRSPRSNLHVGFAAGDESSSDDTIVQEQSPVTPTREGEASETIGSPASPLARKSRPHPGNVAVPSPAHHSMEAHVQPAGGAPPTPEIHNFNSPYYNNLERADSDYFERERARNEFSFDGRASNTPSVAPAQLQRYTANLRHAPPRSFIQQLRPWEGRLHHDNWFRVMLRPFILFAYPAVLWSSAVYACSVGWLIVLSESVAVIYRDASTYNFSALSAGLIYLSPFIGGCIGTAVAGKVSDVIVRAMSRRNGGLYEPEFRLVMAIPVAISTVVGLMGFGWSAQVHDSFIVPTIFFGIISFGCSLGSTTSITFCVDSYRQYAGEALVTLNFSKNIFHGLVFSLFFNSWLEADGSKKVFLALGGIQLGVLVFTIPMYIYGKRARMWTVRKNFMETS